MPEKFKIPRQHSRFNLYQRLFIEKISSNAQEWNVPKKKVTRLLQLQENWVRDMESIPKSTVHHHEAVQKRNETLAEFYAEMELIMEYHLLNNDGISRVDKLLLGISGS